MFSPQKSVQLKLQRFLGIGALGFIVDAAVFFTSVLMLRTNYIVARIVASLVALTTTWLLNRSLTFRNERVHTPIIEFVRYLSASAVGAVSNLAVLAIIAPHDSALWHIPAYVAGAIAGLVVNFLLYDRFVFQGRSASTPESDNKERMP